MIMGTGTPQLIAITSTLPDSAMSLPVLVSTRDSLAHWILTRPVSDFSQIGLATGLCNHRRNPSHLRADHGGQGFFSVQVHLLEATFRCDAIAHCLLAITIVPSVAGARWYHRVGSNYELIQPHTDLPKLRPGWSIYLNTIPCLTKTYLCCRLGTKYVLGPHRGLFHISYNFFETR